MASHSANLLVEINTKVLGAAVVLGFAKDIIGAASDMEQSMGGVDAVFKDNAQAIHDWSEQSAKSIGLSKNSYNELATLIGAQLKNAGTSMEELAPSTNKLIELGADLAAQFGGSTSDAVSALSSLLKGETDPIEKYGVSIKAADISAQKAAMGLSGLTGEADKQATAQATLALLTEQTTDAQGANAREAETAAGKQARLTAEMEDAKATMGKSLLPAWNAVMEVMGKFIPLVTPIVSLLGDLASTIAGLPMPLLAAAAAFGVWMKWGKDIVGTFQSVVGWTKNLGNSFSTMGKSLAIGGAIGIAVVALGTIVQAFQNASKHAEELRNKNNDLADELVKTGGKWTSSADEMQAAQFKQSEAWALAQKAGISYGDALALATGKMKDTAKADELLGKAKGFTSLWDRMTNSNAGAALDDLNGGLAEQEAQVTKTAGEMVKYNNEQADINARHAAGTAALEALSGGLVKHAADTKAAADAATKQAAEQQKANVALFDTAKANAEAAASATELQQGLDDAASSADLAKRSIDGLNNILDALSDRNRDADETAAQLNQAFLDLQSSAKDAAKSHDLNKTALVGWNVAALTSNKTGQDVYKSLTGVSDAYTKSTASAWAAAAATGGVNAANVAARTTATNAYTAFLKTAAGMGLNEKQAKALADKLGILNGTELTDKQLKLLADDKQAQDAIKKYNAAKTPDKKSKIIVDANTAAADAELERLQRTQYKATLKVTITETKKQQGASGFPGWGPTAMTAGFAAPLPSAFGVSPRTANLGTANITIPAPAVTINVSGALDPDAVARQISRLTTARGRRTSGSRIGGQAFAI